MLIRIFSPTECGLIRDADLKKCGLNRMTIVEYWHDLELTRPLHENIQKMWFIILSFLLFLISIPALSQYSLRACPHYRWVLSWCKFREGESASEFEPRHTHASICPTIINLRKVLSRRLMDKNDHLYIVIVIGSPTI
jgi:hypothetical protein